jgi:uncharacterized OB-fold protein
MSAAAEAARAIAPGLFTDGPEGPRLVAGHCAACGQLHFPRGDVCPYCAADACTARAVGPAARLWLYTAVTSRPPGYRGPLPFGFGVVELAGGLRLVTRLTEARLDRLAPGLPMRLVLEALHTDDDGRPVVSYAFRPEAP